MKEQVMGALESIEKLWERRGGITGLSTGFIELDRLTSGLHAAEMIVIAGRPSMGKTALAMNMATRRSKSKKTRRSLQSGDEQPAARPTQLCSRARVPICSGCHAFLVNATFPA